MGGPNIFVGCGGSGLKTILRVHELLTEDPEWRKRMATDVYYVAVDTHTEDLNAFNREVEALNRGARGPYVTSIAIAKGITSLHEVVYPDFGRIAPSPSDARGIRHQRHWWRNPKGDPFIAFNVQGPVTDGAGQCPAIAYLLAWKRMGDVDRELRKVIDEIRRRRKAERPLEGARFTVTGSLAGGTGRGCWNLVAYKLRTFFEEAGQSDVMVEAYFYDASTFNDVMEAHPETKLAMHVNSLTGASELSCWMKNTQSELRDEPTYDYRLPRLESPWDETADVIAADLSLNPKSSRPVDIAHLVFRASTATHLATSSQFQSMVGTALYAKTTLAHLKGVQINLQNNRYRGLGVASFEVNATQIRKYFESRARTRLLDRLLESDASRVEDDAQDVLDDLQLLVRASDNSLDAFKSDAKGDLLQRSLYHLEQARKPRLDNLHKKLEADDPAQVKRFIEEALVPSRPEAEAALGKALSELVGSGGSGDIAQRVAARMQVALEERLKRHASPKDVLDFLAACEKRLQDVVDGLPSAHHMEAGAKKPLMEWVTASKKEYVVFGPHFNAEERQRLKDLTRAGIGFVHYTDLRNAIARTFDSLKAPFAQWRSSAAGMLKRVEHLRTELKHDLARDAHAGGGDVFHLLFADPTHPERSIPESFSESIFYKRELRPVLTRDEEREALDRALAASSGAAAQVVEVLHKAMFAEDARLSADRYERTRAFDEQLKAALAGTVRLPRNFMEQFRFRPVIERLRGAWLERLRAARGDEDHLHALQSQFTTFFGVEVESIGDDFDMPDPPEFLLAMAASLARTCKCYWQARKILVDRSTDRSKRDEVRNPSNVVTDSITLFLPDIGDAADDGGLREAMMKALPDLDGRFSVVTGKTASASNPYIVLAHATSSTDELEDILSLDYYRSDAQVKRWLELCESPTGDSWFTSRDGQKGIGYIDPIYVHEPRLANYRWRPWLTKEGPDLKTEHQALDALLYALYEPPEALASQLGKIGWTLPVATMGAKQRIAFTRQAYSIEEWQRSGTTTADPRPWKTGDILGIGLHRALAVLRGQGDKQARDSDAWRAWRPALYGEAEVFWTSVGTKLGFGAGSDRRKDLWRVHRDRFATLLTKAKRETEEYEALDQLLKRIEEHLRT